MDILEQPIASEGMQSVVSLYEALYTVSEKILEVSKAEAWDDLAALEQQHFEVYTRLSELERENGHQQALGPEALDKKATLLNQILLMNKQTQVLIKQRMDRLQKGGEEERKILQSYGVHVV